MTITPTDLTTDEPHRKTAEEVLTALRTDADRGLTEAEAERRLARVGANELDSAEPRPEWRKFLDQFLDILVLLLIAAACISAAIWLHERATAAPYEAIAIMAIVILNGMMGYIQEARAERAVAALRAMTAAHANVVRDGERRSVPTTTLVPGDIKIGRAHV